MVQGANLFASDYSKQIQEDISTRLSEKITPPESLIAQLERCANDAATLAQRDFLSHHERKLAVNDYLDQQMQRYLPPELAEYQCSSQSARMLKNLIGMLNVKAESFTAEEKKIYQQVCEDFKSIKHADGEVDFNTLCKYDSKVWVKLVPLVKTYGSEIMKDLMANMIDQSINIWCRSHPGTTPEWARSNLDKVFNPHVRSCFYMFDRENTVLSELSAEHPGTMLRHAMYANYDFIAAVPTTLMDMENPQKENTPEPATSAREGAGHPTANPSESPGSPVITRDQGGIHVYGAHCCCNKHATASNDESWKTLAEQFRLSEARNQKSLELMDKLMDAIMHTLGPISAALTSDDAAPTLAHALRSRSPMLSQLQRVVANGHEATSAPDSMDKGGANGHRRDASHNASFVDRRSRPRSPLPDYPSDSDDETRMASGLPVGGTHMPVNTPESRVTSSLSSNQDHDAPLRSQHTDSLSSTLSTLSEALSEAVPGARPLSAKPIPSIDTGLRPKNPLSNFSLATWDERRKNNQPRVFTVANDAIIETPLENVTPLLRRRQGGEGLTLTAATPQRVNDGIRRDSGILSVSASPTESESSVQRATQHELPLEDTQRLKRWLLAAAQAEEDENEIATIASLKHAGTYVTTIAHFLESSFIASPETEIRSDKRQRYIKEAFNLLKADDDYYALGEKARNMVDKYAAKYNKKVFATSPTRLSYLPNGFF